MISTPPDTFEATAVPLPPKTSFLTAAEAAALFDPDVRDISAILERSRKTTDRSAA